VLPFAELPATHFGRVLVVPAPAGGSGADTLVLTLECDAPVHRRLRDLADLVGEGLDRLFGTCEDYPTRPTSAARVTYLRDHLWSCRVLRARRGEDRRACPR